MRVIFIQPEAYFLYTYEIHIYFYIYVKYDCAFFEQLHGTRFMLCTVSAGGIWAVGPLPTKCFIVLAEICKGALAPPEHV